MQGQIVKTLLGNLLRSTTSTPPRLKDVFHDSTLLAIASHHSNSSLRDVLWTKSGVSVMSNAFEAISKASPRYSSEEDFPAAWHGCFILLLQLAKMNNGQSFLIQAIHESLLRNFVVYSPGIPRPENLEARSILSECIRKLQILLPLGPVLLALFRREASF